jgi:hypothetical protein
VNPDNALQKLNMTMLESYFGIVEITSLSPHRAPECIVSTHSLGWSSPPPNLKFRSKDHLWG